VASQGGQASGPETGRRVKKLVVFDLDGTLIDSRQDLADAANAALQEHGLEPLAVDAVAAMVGEGARVLLERAFAARGALPDDDALTSFLRLYDTRLTAHTRPYPGVAGMLAAVAARARVGVLSNKPQRPSERLIEHFEFDRYVHFVVGGDGPMPRKPDPGGLLWLMAAGG